ncbi:MAG: chemotaxis protein CheW [Planctomycetota bacterium]|jgi:purine-binding chemotaxis protein CheW
MRQLCTFQIGKLACAVDVADVREVIRPRMPTPVPQAPEGVVGLVSLRGQILTAFDPGPRLGLEPRTREAPYGIVIDGGYCVLVDEVGDVGEAQPDRFEPPPGDLPAELAGVVEASYREHRVRFLVLSSAGIKP